MSKENTFRIIPERGAKAHPLTIPWSLAELAYSVYAGLYGTGQSLERISERGGFYPSEMDQYVPDWRERCDRCESLEQENARLREELAKSRLTWSDEVPTEEGWYWVRPEGSSDWIHYLDQFILDRQRRRKDDDKSMRFCRIPEPQEPSE